MLTSILIAARPHLYCPIIVICGWDGAVGIIKTILLMVVFNRQTHRNLCNSFIRFLMLWYTYLLDRVYVSSSWPSCYLCSYLYLKKYYFSFSWLLFRKLSSVSCFNFQLVSWYGSECLPHSFFLKFHSLLSKPQ